MRLVAAHDHLWHIFEFLEHCAADTFAKIGALAARVALGVPRARVAGGEQDGKASRGKLGLGGEERSGWTCEMRKDEKTKGRDRANTRLALIAPPYWLHISYVSARRVLTSTIGTHKVGLHRHHI
jgi:hypothetical protein